MLKIELGGGSNPKGEGFINLDYVPGELVDKVVNFADPNVGIPFPDASVDEVYSSHCMEHIADPGTVIREIARVCRPGARVELRMPHWLSEGAHVPGHLWAASTEVAEHIHNWWCPPDSGPRKLNHIETHHHPCPHRIGAGREAFPDLSDDQLCRLIPGMAHEIEMVFIVAEQEQPETPSTPHLTKLQQADVLAHPFDPEHPVEDPWWGDYYGGDLEFDGLRIHEFGCGPGWNTVGLLKQGAVVDASDARPRHLASTLLRCLWNGVTPSSLALVDVNDPLPPDLRGYDILWHTGLLYHLANPIAHLKDLKGRGEIIVLDTHVARTDGAYSDNNLISEQMSMHHGYPGRVYSERDPGGDYSGCRGDSFFFTRDALMDLLTKEVGFKVEQILDVESNRGDRVGLHLR